MSPISTLSYVADPTLAREFSPFWVRWDEIMRGLNPLLVEFHGDPSVSGDPGVTHTLTSMGDVTIGARLLLPEGVIKPSAVVVKLHGYMSSPLHDENPWADAGVAVLQLRVRGYPGSWFETGNLKQTGPGHHGWFCHGLEDLATWVLPNAVADVVCACKAVKSMFGSATPVMLAGESFGGGLAVLAASRLSGMGVIDRIAVGLPSMGAWRWRLERSGFAGVSGDGGINSELMAWINLHRDREEAIIQNLVVCDTAIHARNVHIPALFKLAERDDVVPAPAAAAVYNALGTDAGLKHREIVRYGHFDGGIADGRRHAHWNQLAVEFLDPANVPALLIHRWSSDRAH